MGTYKHIGRIRSARKVGLSLAEFYIEANEHQKAIGFLSDALKTFECDRWNDLVVAVLLQLAKCYLAISDNERFVNFSNWNIYPERIMILKLNIHFHPGTSEHANNFLAIRRLIQKKEITISKK